MEGILRMSRNKTIILYDGDSIAFRAAAVTETRTVDITHIKSGRTKEFKTRTELKKQVEQKGLVYNKEDFTYEDKRVAQPIQNTLAILKNQIKRINEDLFADDYLICLSGKSNFRDSLPLPTKYKGSRIGIEKPINLLEAKMYLWKNHPSLLANNREADDDLIIKGYEYLNKGYEVILASQDKDAFAYTGLNLYDFTQEKPELKLVPDFGSLWINEQNKLKTVKGNGFIWFCFQWLFGDPADDYNPCDIAKIKYGQMSAYKLLNNCKTHQEALQAVISMFKVWYPQKFTYTAWDGSMHEADYVSMLQLYFRCARMMTTENDTLDLIEFLDKYGVKL
jgi:hypothetical protein